MEKKHIRKEIAALINSIKEHSDNIGDREQIPQLELELILHKIEKLYQKSIVYNHLNSEETAVFNRPERKEEKAEKAEEKTIVPEPEIKAPVIQPPVVEPPKVEIPTTELPKDEPKAEIKPGEIKEVKKEEPKPEVKAVDLFGSELPPAVEKPKAEKKPLEKKDNPTQVPVGSFQKPPIADLRAAIGINDRFLFASELFGGEMQEYEIAIQQLNSAETRTSALAYFGSLQQLYNWDNEHETVKRLHDLVERRYS